MTTRVTCFLFSKEMERTRVPGKLLVSTCGDSVISLSTEADLNNISGCTHEECHKKIIIRTDDTNVVVLAISVVEEIKVEELRIAFGTGNISDTLQPTQLSWCRQIKSFVARSHSLAGQDN